MRCIRLLKVSLRRHLQRSDRISFAIHRADTTPTRQTPSALVIQKGVAIEARGVCLITDDRTNQSRFRYVANRCGAEKSEPAGASVELAVRAKDVVRCRRLDLLFPSITGIDLHVFRCCQCCQCADRNAFRNFAREFCSAVDTRAIRRIDEAFVVSSKCLRRATDASRVHERGIEPSVRATAAAECKDAAALDEERPL